MKRTVYLLHRWLGVALCLLMALWFVSGLVMVYVGYPKLTTAERLAALPALDAAHCRIDAAPALSAKGGAAPESLRLTSVAAQPLLVAQIDSKRQLAFHADGAPLAAVDEAQALASARAFAPTAAPLRYQGAVQEDAWTHSRALDAHRPLHRVLAGDTLLYISSATGEVVRDATATERHWGWIGTWLHWWYVFRGIGFDSAWTQFIIYASLLATALTALGLMVGVWRWRFAAYKSGARSPYRQRWMRWHHVGGLLFGLGTLSFIFSGLMSMNPWQLFDHSAAAALKERQAAAMRLDAAAFALPPCDALKHLSANGFAPRELAWRMAAGHPWYLALDATGKSRLLAADVANAAPQAALDAATLEPWGCTLGPEGAQATADWITHEDMYYYHRAAHTMTGHYERPLPVLRLRFDDPAATWLYLDPASGALVQQSDAPRRASRWLFAFLHSWDAPALLALRPLWDGWMWLLSLGGLLISASGVVIGVRRLRLKLRPPTAQRTSKPVAAPVPHHV